MKLLIGVFSFLLVCKSLCAVMLIVHADAPCRLTIDGKPRAVLIPNKILRLKLAPGPHSIEATPSAGGDKWLRLIALPADAVPQRLLISLTTQRDYWIDSSRGFMWTSADNGSGLSWHQAIRYCSDITVAGFHDWALPSINDLRGIFDSSPSNEAAFHLKAPLTLTGWQWSATPGQEAGKSNGSAALGC